MSENKLTTGKKGCVDAGGDPSIPYGPSQKPWSRQVPECADVTAPLEDPISVYPQVPPANVEGDFPTIDYRMFEIPPTGLTAGQRADALAALMRYERTQWSHFTGFQANQDQGYSLSLSWLMDMHTNNIGDPFQSGLYTLNSKFCERAVLDYFAALWNNHWPHHDDTTVEKYPDRHWGYVLTMGCTEANIYGLFNARDYLKGRMLIEDKEAEAKNNALLARGKEAPEKRFVYVNPLDDPDNPNQWKPIVFYSEDVHYSVVKAVRVLELTTFAQEGNTNFKGQCPITENGEWPDEVPSHNHDESPLSGTIKVRDLEQLVGFFVKRGYPPLIVLNLGSTWKGAYDDVPAVNQMLKRLRLDPDFHWLWDRPVEYERGYTDHRRGFWVHVDAALGGPFLPFIEMAYNRDEIDKKGPVFDFRNETVMSIGCSLHKWIGAPFPSGIYMTRTGYQLMPPDTAGYIGSADTTLGGSRSGLAPIVFWDYLSRMSYEDNMRKALDTEKVSGYLEGRLRDLEAKLQGKFGPQVDLWIARSHLALTVRFRLVNPTISYKWTVDSERLWVPISPTEKQLRSYSHVFVMHSMTEERVDAFIEDIWEASQDDWHSAFPEWDGDEPNPGEIKPITPPTPGRPDQIVFVPHKGRGFGAFVHPSKRG